jgi:hypothetical protein
MKEAIDLVIENSVALQKVVAELAVNLKKLSSDTSEMLDLFREATRTMASEKAEEEAKKSDIDELKAKVDELVDQNKIIAKGILLLESSLKPKEYSSY